MQLFPASQLASWDPAKPMGQGGTERVTAWAGEMSRMVCGKPIGMIVTPPTQASGPQAPGLTAHHQHPPFADEETEVQSI